MRTFFRKFLVLAAAYALALQPAFAAISAAHVQAAEFCAASRADVPLPTDTRQDHKDNECCLALGCNATGDAPPLRADAAPAFDAIVLRLGIFPSALLAAWPNERPHSARAPPV